MRLFIALAISAFTVYAQTVQTLTSAGSGTWTAPAGVTSIKIECIGGGGAGATMTSNGGGGGGKGGDYAARLTMAVTPNVQYSYTIGAAGTTNGGANGGVTTFTGDGGVQCIAAGGNSVVNNSATGATGSNGTSTGDVAHVFAGGNGANGSAGSYGGGGGSSGGSAAGGNTATNASGATAVTGGGPGGNGKSSPQGTGGAPANGPGGGGGGGLRTSSGTRNGGAGWAGQIKITYNTLTTAVSDGVVIASATVGQYTNNSAKTAVVTENIQYVSSDQSRWGLQAASAVSISDIAGRVLSASVTDMARSITANEWFGVVPAENYGAEVIENIQYVPSEQSRVGIAQTNSILLVDVNSTSQAGYLHLTASVSENIPYTPATIFEWGSGPTPDGMQAKETTSQAYSPGLPLSTHTVPRRPIIIR